VNEHFQAKLILPLSSNFRVRLKAAGHPGARTRWGDLGWL